MELTFEESNATTPAAFEVRRFSYVSKPPHEWPYGTGFAVADRKSREVLWMYLHDGDFPPHGLHWADFDGDGRDDLFFHAGFEDVATTHVYVNRIHSASFGVSHFAQAYENPDVYAVVVDLDADGRPELIAPDSYPSEDDDCGESFRQLAGSSEPWKKEHARIAGRFDDFNDTTAAYDALGLFTKPTIVAIGPQPAPEAVVRHLQLRKELIGAASESLPPPCRTRAAEVTAYLQRLVDAHR